MKQPAPIESLSAAQARREHARLGEEIAAHDRRYYTDDAPTVSDAEYDALRQRYEALEAAFPGLATPGRSPKKSAQRHPKNSQRCATACRCSRLAIFSPRKRQNLLRAFAAFLGSAKPHSSPSLPNRRSMGFPARCVLNGRFCPGGNPRGWLRRRGRHRQCPHHRRNSASSQRPSARYS